MQEREKFSILLVDDDSMTVRILSRILCGFEPLRFATSGRAALKLARESVPDLMLLDVDMPEWSGFEVCKAFKSDSTLSEVPIIFITSHQSAQLEAKGLELGAADYISKPPHAPLVLARVRTYQRLKILSDTMRSAVRMDFLTGALTRRELEKTLTHEWLRAERSAAPLALLLADIQGFAAYNAEFGEDRGDVYLKAVADRLRLAAHRPADVLGRYAGGQFAVLLPHTDERGASAVALRAIAAVNDLDMGEAAAAGRSGMALAVGAGCRIFPGAGAYNDSAGLVPSDLLAAAELALGNARSSGKYQVRIIDAHGRSDSTPASAAR